MTDDGLVDITEERRAQGELTPSSHYVIQDSMDATWHPVTGEMIDSKSRFRRRTKESTAVKSLEMTGQLNKNTDTPAEKKLFGCLGIRRE